MVVQSTDRDSETAELELVLAELSYPVTKDALVQRIGHLSPAYASAEESVGDVLARVETGPIESKRDASEAIATAIAMDGVSRPRYTDRDAGAGDAAREWF